MKPLRFLGHPIHPMLIPLPLGLFPASFAFDLAYVVSGDPYWAGVSFWMLTAGLIGAALAAVFGLLDFLAIPARTRAHRVGLYHGLGNAVVTTLFAVSWFLRHAPADGYTPLSAVALSFVALMLSLVTAWLGGELVTRYGVGVDHDANVNASGAVQDAEKRLRQPDAGGKVVGQHQR